MGNHWPIAIAIIFVGAAIGYGLYQQDDLEKLGQAQSNVKPLPAVYIATPPAAAPVTPKAPVAIAPTAPIDATRALVSRIQPAQPVQVAQPTQAVQLPPTVLPLQLGQQSPSQIRQVEAMGMGGLAPISPGTTRGNAFTSLRGALIQKFGTAPMATQNGGFAISADGVRVEADPSADWALSLYNNNPAAPAVQTENFKSALNLVVANFELDMTAQPNVGADGKQTLRTVSKVGRVSMVTDPAMGNSITIKPIQRKTPQLVTPQNGGPAAPTNPTAPMLPGKPLPPVQVKPAPQQQPLAPVQPPRAPVNEQF